MRSFTYNDLFIDLGEIGEHELEIMALVESLDGRTSVSIMEATALVRVTEDIQRLNVTEQIQENSDWKARIRNAYERFLSREWDDDDSGVG